MYSKSEVGTGLFEVNVTVPNVGMGVLAFFSRKSSLSRTRFNKDTEDTGVTYSDYFIADATLNPSQYWLSREFSTSSETEDQYAIVPA
jgi:hypothetical protein